MEHLCTFGGALSGNVFEIAVNDSGSLYSTDGTALYSVNTETCVGTRLTALTDGSAVFGMTFTVDGTLLAVEQSGAVDTIDVSTGAIASAGSFGNGLSAAGGLAALSDGTIFATAVAIDGGPSNESLVHLDATNRYAATVIGATGSTNTYGLAYWGGLLYGFTATGQVLSLSLETGAGTVITTDSTLMWLSAASSPEAPLSTTSTGSTSGSSSSSSSGSCTLSATFATHIDFPAGAHPGSLVTRDFDHDGHLDVAVLNSNDGGSTDTLTVLHGLLDGGLGNPTSYSTGLNSLVIGTGDFNGDGFDDLAVTLASGTCLVFLGDADGGFSALGGTNTGPAPTALVIADFNNDGYDDIALTNDVADGGAITVLLGPPGLAVRRATYAVGSSPSAIATADFNGDHSLDLAVANFGDNSVSILFGYTDAGFAAPTTLSASTIDPCCAANPNSPILCMSPFCSSFACCDQVNCCGYNQAPPSGPVSMVVNDFSGDRRADLALVSSQGVLVFVGDGDGGFSSPPALYGSSNNPQTIGAADFSGDGVPDLAVSEFGGNDLATLVSESASGFAAQTTAPTGAGPIGLGIADFNGDTRPDVVVSNRSDGTVSVLLNTCH